MTTPAASMSPADVPEKTRAPRIRADKKDRVNWHIRVHPRNPRSDSSWAGQMQNAFPRREALQLRENVQLIVS
jgi:hypothetical protein